MTGPPADQEFHGSASDSRRIPPGGDGYSGPSAQPLDPFRSGRPAPPMPAAGRSRRVRVVLLVLTVVALVLCGGGAAVGYLLYDRATAPNLTSPAAVVREYIQTYLNDRNDTRAALLVCKSGSQLSEVRALRTDVASREKTYGLSISIGTDSVQESSRSGKTAHVAAEIVLSTIDNGTSLRRVQSWDFIAVNDSGWRVCGAHQVGS